MRLTFYNLFLLLSFSVLAQNNPVNTTSPFIRVYDLDNKKIGKGVIVALNDSFLFIQRHESILKFSYTDIGKLKPTRSYGHNVLISMGGSGTLFGVFGLLNYNENRIGTVSRGQETVAGALNGVFFGTLICSAYQIFKHKYTARIRGNYESWQTFKNQFTHLPSTITLPKN